MHVSISHDKCACCRQAVPHLSDIVGPGAALPNIRYSLSKAAQKPVPFFIHIKHGISLKMFWTQFTVGTLLQLQEQSRGRAA